MAIESVTFMFPAIVFIYTEHIHFLSAQETDMTRSLAVSRNYRSLSKHLFLHQPLFSALGWKPVWSSALLAHSSKNAEMLFRSLRLWLSEVLHFLSDQTNLIILL